MRVNTLWRRFDAIYEKIGDIQENYLNSEDWQQLRAILLQESRPFPIAEQALNAAIIQLERDRVTPRSQGYTQQAVCNALNPYLDARIAIAAALMERAHK